MSKLKIHHVEILVGSKYFDRSCSLRAEYFDGQPCIYHISRRQYLNACNKCGIIGSDELVRWGVRSDVQLMVVADDPYKYQWLGWR